MGSLVIHLRSAWIPFNASRRSGMDSSWPGPSRARTQAAKVMPRPKPGLRRNRRPEQKTPRRDRAQAGPEPKPDQGNGDGSFPLASGATTIEVRVLVDRRYVRANPSMTRLHRTLRLARTGGSHPTDWHPYGSHHAPMSHRSATRTLMTHPPLTRTPVPYPPPAYTPLTYPPPTRTL